MNNPYHAPSADLSHAGGAAQTYTPRLFSTDGRIGRVRYFVYTCLYSLIAFFVCALAVGMLAVPFRDMVPVLAIAAYVPIIGISMIPAIRRLNDLNRAGWWSLLGLVPLVNLGFAIWVLFFPGDSQANDYGPAPEKNSIWLYAGILLPFILVGILAAIAVPQYQSYLEKARASKAAQDAAAAPAPDALEPRR